MQLVGDGARIHSSEPEFKALLSPHRTTLISEDIVSSIILSKQTTSRTLVKESANACFFCILTL